MWVRRVCLVAFVAVAWVVPTQAADAPAKETLDELQGALGKADAQYASALKKADAEYLSKLEDLRGRAVQVANSGPLLLAIQAKVAELKKRLAPAEKQEEPKEKEQASPYKVRVVAAMELPKNFAQRKFRVKPVISATSFSGADHRPEYACDSDPSTEFAFSGPVGTIRFDYGKGGRCSMVVFHARRAATDVIKVGIVTINGKYHHDFQDWGGGYMLIIDVPDGALIKSISIQSVKGECWPGIADSYLVR